MSNKVTLIHSADSSHSWAHSSRLDTKPGEFVKYFSAFKLHAWSDSVLAVVPVLAVVIVLVVVVMAGLVVMVVVVVLVEVVGVVVAVVLFAGAFVVAGAAVVVAGAFVVVEAALNRIEIEPRDLLTLVHAVL